MPQHALRTARFPVNNPATIKLTYYRRGLVRRARRPLSHREAPAPIAQEAQPAAAGLICQKAEAVDTQRSIPGRLASCRAARFYVALIKGRLNQARIPMPRCAFTAVRV